MGNFCPFMHLSIPTPQGPLEALSGEYELGPSPLSGKYKVGLSPLRGEIDVGLSPLRGEIDVGLSPLSGEFAPQWTRLLGSHFLIMLSPLSGPPKIGGSKAKIESSGAKIGVN